MSKAKRFLVVLLLLPLWGTHPAAGAGPPSQSSQVEAIRERGYLRIRCFPQQLSSFMRVDTELGPMPKISGPEHFLGVDIEVLGHVARELGVELRIQPGDRPGISSSFEALAAGEGDLVAGGLTITEKRRQRFAFSRPYFQFRDLLISIDGTDSDPPPLATSRLAVMRGSSFDDRLSRLGLDEKRILRYDFISEAYEAIVQGIPDYTFADSTVIHPERLPGLAPVYKLAGTRSYGYVLPKGSDLKAVIDRVLDRLERNGELARILDKHGAHGAIDLEALPEIPWTALVGESLRNSDKVSP